MFLKMLAPRESWRRATTAILLGIAFQDLVFTKHVLFLKNTTTVYLDIQEPHFSSNSYETTLLYMKYKNRVAP